jgi:hypothetical protein
MESVYTVHFCASERAFLLPTAKNIRLIYWTLVDFSGFEVIMLGFQVDSLPLSFREIFAFFFQEQLTTFMVPREHQQ